MIYTYPKNNRNLDKSTYWMNFKMRIVWKDSAVTRADFKYRGYWIEGYKNGWTISIPGDYNVYRTNRCCENAIDIHLGLEEAKNYKKLVKRREYDVDIIGKKDNQKSG